MNKEQIFAALEAEVKELEVKALGCVLRFKVMTGKARDAFQEAIANGDKSASHFEASVVAASVVDADGKPMFDAADVDTLRDKNASAVSEVAKLAMQVNRIGADAEETAAKN